MKISIVKRRCCGARLNSLACPIQHRHEYSEGLNGANICKHSCSSKMVNIPATLVEKIA